MSKLHIFNPEHDIALASNLSNFTAPHAGRQLRHDLAFLPALWAGEGDALLVDDVEVARKGLLRLSHKCSPLSGFCAEAGSAKSRHTSMIVALKFEMAFTSYLLILISYYS